MTRGIASSAFGRMSLFDTVSAAIGGGRQHLMITIGSTPVPNPDWEISALRANGITVSAHHNAPIGWDEIIYADQTDKMIAQLNHLGIDRYSRHPPSYDQFNDWGITSWADSMDWAIRTWQKYQDAGIQFSLETMYPIKHNGTEKLCWLDKPPSVLYFVKEAQEFGWEKPLAADVSHMHIADWPVDYVSRLVDLDCVAEVHYSANDGKHDQHRPIGSAEPECSYLALLANTGPSVLYIDEGRTKLQPMQRRP